MSLISSISFLKFSSLSFCFGLVMASTPVEHKGQWRLQRFVGSISIWYGFDFRLNFCSFSSCFAKIKFSYFFEVRNSGGISWTEKLQSSSNCPQSSSFLFISKLTLFLAEILFAAPNALLFFDIIFLFFMLFFYL